MATRIYTRGGDKGETGLWGGDRVTKDHLRVAAYGDIDELNATLGIAQSFGPPAKIAAVVERLQGILFALGAQLATPPGVEAPAELQGDLVVWLEKTIDEVESELPPLKQFILPGGTKTAAFLHQARTVCRRAERSIVALHGQESAVPALILELVNRLSDLLFVLARLANHLEGTGDVPWQPVPS